MANRTVEQRLRRFLLAVTVAIFIGSVIELLLVNHTEETLQWTPFIISALGFIAVLTVWFFPTRQTVLILRGVMVLAVLASLLGMYLHFEGNLGFTREINPSYSFTQALWPALQGGNPLLAPGIILLAGLLGYAATYEHPELRG